MDWGSAHEWLLLGGGLFAGFLWGVIVCSYLAASEEREAER